MEIKFTGSEVEPGSGSSIMGYAGICNPNVQFNSDAHFNYVNIKQIADYVINETGASCAGVIPIANQAPIANAGPDYTIPTNTPYLTGTASDVDGLSSLTYNWSQNDPIFRLVTQHHNQIGSRCLVSFAFTIIFTYQIFSRIKSGG